MRVQFLLAIPMLATTLFGCEATELVSYTAGVTLKPTVLDFSQVALGASSLKSATVTNTGNAPLSVTSISPTHADFELGLQNNPIPAHGKSELIVRFSPTQEHHHSEKISLETNAERQSTVYLQLQAQGVMPMITVSPEQLDFGTLELGDSVRRTITVRNHRATEHTVQLDLLVDILGQTPYQLEGAPERLIPGNGSIEIHLWFTAEVGGRQPAQLTVEACGGPCPNKVNLTAQVNAPRFMATPMRVQFEDTPPAAEQVRSLTLVNAGLGRLQVEHIDLESPAFAAALPPLPLWLDAGQELVIEVRFAPQIIGQHQALVLVASDDPQSSLGYVELEGVCTGAHLEVIPSALEYGIVGSIGPHLRNIVLRNRGDQSARIYQATLSGDTAFALVNSPQMPLQLSPNETAIFAISFLAEQQGAQQAHLTLHSDVPTARQREVPIAGDRQPRQCYLLASIEQLQFGHVHTGTSIQIPLQLQNLGQADCQIVSFGFSPVLPNDGAFDFVRPPTTDLGPGDTAEMAVSFSPTATGRSKATLLLQVDDPAAPEIAVSLEGYGITSAVSVAPAVVDFGTVSIGALAQRPVTITNHGSVGVALSSFELQSGSSRAFAFLAPTIIGELAPGTVFPTTLGFSPQRPGYHYTNVDVTTGDGLASFSIPVVGQAVDLCGTDRTEHFSVAGNSQVDILFVVDNSQSMEDNQENLANNFLNFIHYADFAGEQVSFQIGVTTADTADGGEQGRFVGQPRVLSNQTPDLASGFAQAVLVGTAGSWHENGLEAMYLALDEHRYGYNSGFLRDTAALAVVVVSDEDDGGTQPINDTTLQPVSFYTSFLLGLKANSDGHLPVLFHAVTGGVQGCATATPAPRYQQAVEQTSGHWMNICSGQWGEQLQQLGAAIFLQRARYWLAGQPQTQTIVVRVNGAAVPSGHWTYDAPAQLLAFVPEHIPATGSAIEVSYTHACF